MISSINAHPHRGPDERRCGGRAAGKGGPRVAPLHAGASNPPPGSGLSAMECARILLVDDDPAVRSSIAFALEVEGFEVKSFASAEAALADGSARQSACIVLDHRLPGMDGLALLARLRAEGVDAPAVIITSNPSRRFEQRVREEGACLIEKPLLRDSLTAAIRRLTHAPPPPTS